VIDKNKEEWAIWITSFDVNESYFEIAQNIYFFCGDTEGSLMKFVQSKDYKSEGIYELSKKYPLAHKNGIQKILIAEEDNLIFTISYDQKAKGFDGINGNGLNK